VLISLFLAWRIALPHSASGSSGQEWRSYGHDPGGVRFSPLKQINQTNVRQLQRAWTYEVPTSQGSWIQAFESTPLMVNDVLFFATQTGVAIAVDAETGKQLWTFDPFVDAREKPSPVPNRGVGYWEGNSPVACAGEHAGWQRRIFYTTPDARLFALDAATGNPCKAFGKSGAINLREGVASEWPKLQYDVTSPPAIYKDLIIMGSEVQEYPSKGPSGAVRAFDARTGKLAWTFHTVPQPGQLGHSTWQGDGWKDRSGTNAWGPISVDVEYGLAFLPVSSPSYDFYGADRKGQSLFGDSLVAVNAETGKLVWYYQIVHHDLWDTDLPAQPMLVTLRRGGREIPAVVVVGKAGFIFVFNRLTGKPLFPIEEQPVAQSHLPGEATWPTQPFPAKLPRLARTLVTRRDITTVTPESHKYCLENFGSILPGGIFNPWSQKLTLEMPGTMGGTDWGGASFDPASGYLFANTTNLGAVGEMKRQPPGSPETYVWGSPWGSYARFWDDNNYPCQQPPWGTLNAVNLTTGDLAWKVPLGVVDDLKAKGIPKTGIYNLGGSIVTAGGLVFIGATADRRFRAFDAQTGKQLWVTRLEANGYATPMTYLGARTKKQFVVIAVGPSARFSTGASAPTVLAAYTLFPKEQTSPAQSAMQAQVRLPVHLGIIPGGPGSEPPEITPPLPAPAQPVPFSHRVHASAGLQCENCHQLSGNGQRMGIPDLSQCLLCHQTVAKGSLAIQQLIQRKKQHQSISWIPVYKLPNFVFFSHQTHIEAKVKCEVCHGVVGSLHVMRQEKDISMVSCVNCHKLRKAPISCGTCHNIGY
jgi:quinate dehydrogenase (quinone)